MRKWIALGATIAVAVAFAACAPQQTAEMEAPEETMPAMSPEEIMYELAERWDAGMNAADADAMLALYADDGGAMPPEQPAVTGKEALRTFFDEFFIMGEATVKDVVQSVVADGDHVAGKGSYTLSMKNADGESMEQSGSWLSVSVKQADGSYATLRNIWNRDAPLPGMPEQPPIAESGAEAAADAACYGSPTELDQGFEAELEAGNAAALVAMHTEDGARIPPDMPAMEGRAQIAAYLASRMEPFSERVLDLTDIVETVDGSFGMTRGRFEFHYMGVDGSHVMGEGKYLTVSRQGDDGCWRLHWVLWNGDAPPTA